MPDDLQPRLQAALGHAYTIERELGGGGMSRVFVATETALGREVVIKVLPPELAGELSSERFRREIQLAARLQHPHIVPVLSAGTGATMGDAGAAPSAADEGTVLYYSMPLIEGETLRARLMREGELPVHAVVRIGREIADALAYAHDRGVVHRDLKPENILLTHGHALVADFGVAKAVTAAVRPGADGSALTSVGLALGTPAYMAPEQAAADPATDHRADLYALGIVLYELLAGATPFAGRPMQALLAAHVAEAPDPIARRRPATPQPLAALVMALLEKRPADRPQRAADVLRVLETLESVATPTTRDDAQLVAGVPGTASIASPASAAATAPGVAAPAPAAGSRRPWRIGLVAGAVVGLALVAGVATLMAGRWGSASDSADATAVAIAGFDAADGAGALASAAATVRTELRDAASTVSRATVVEEGSRAARWLVAGELEPLGRDSAVVRARLVEAGSGKVLRIFTPAVVPLADPRQGLEGLGSRVRGALALVLHPSLGPGALPRADAPTAESFAEFEVALAQLERRVSGITTDTARTTHNLRRAAALDTAFLQPRIWLAVFAGNGGPRATIAALDTVLLEVGDRLAPFERALVDWRSASAKDDLPSAVRASDRLYALSPSITAGEFHTRALLDVGRYRDAIALMDSLAPRAASDRPNFWSYYTGALHMTGQHARELRVARRARELMPDRQGVRGFEISALIALDSLAAADRVVAESIALPDEGDTQAQSTPYNRYTSAVNELRAHGHAAHAATYRDRLRELAPRLDHAAATLPMRRSAVNALLAAGDPAAALERAREAMRRGDTASIALQVYVAEAAMLVGDTAAAEAARQRVEVLAVSQPDGTTWARDMSRARIAASMGRTADALQLASRAVTSGGGHAARRNLHQQRAFERLRQLPDFQRLVRPER